MMICIIKKIRNIIPSLAIVLGIWFVLSKIYNPFIIPTIGSVFDEIVNILSNVSTIKEIMITIKRLLIGLIIGISSGLFLGILLGKVKILNTLFAPIINTIRVIPPISWVVLAMIWLGLNDYPSIFIVIISTMPTIFICVIDGINNIDKKFIEMAHVFKISKRKQLKSIIIPSIIPYFKSGLKIVIGSSWKVIIMAEVLTVNNGIGGAITEARLNIETQTVIAWTVIVVFLSFILDKIVSLLFLDKEIEL